MEKITNDLSSEEERTPENDLFAQDEQAKENEQPVDAALSFENEFQKEHIGFTRKKALILVAALVVAIIAITVLSVWLLPKPTGLPKFSEVMTSNRNAYLHPQYGSVDWIEIYNPTDADIDLSGYGFTNDLKHHQFRYRFPEGTILKPGAYLVLYCTGGTDSSDSDPFCTGFNLSKDGEKLFLITPMKVEADELIVPALETDVAYARTGNGSFEVTEYPTPGKENRFE